MDSIKKRGVPVEYVLFPDDWHGWRKTRPDQVGGRGDEIVREVPKGRSVTGPSAKSSRAKREAM